MFHISSIYKTLRVIRICMLCYLPLLLIGSVSPFFYFLLGPFYPLTYDRSFEVSFRLIYLSVLIYALFLIIIYILEKICEAVESDLHMLDNKDKQPRK